MGNCPGRLSTKECQFFRKRGYCFSECSRSHNHSTDGSLVVSMGGIYAEISESQLRKESGFFEAYIQRWKSSQQITIRGFHNDVCEVILSYLIFDNLPLRRYTKVAGFDGIEQAAEYLGMDRLANIIAREKSNTREFSLCQLCNTCFALDENTPSSCTRSIVDGKCTECGQEPILCRDLACDRTPLIGYHLPVTADD